MELVRELTAFLPPERVLTRRIDRIAHANDASVYRLVPRVVVYPVGCRTCNCLVKFNKWLIGGWHLCQ